MTEFFNLYAEEILHGVATAYKRVRYVALLFFFGPIWPTIVYYLCCITTRLVADRKNECNWNTNPKEKIS